MAGPAPPRRGLGDLSEGALGLALLLPAALLLALVVLVPVGRLVWLSLFELQLTRPGAVPAWVGLENYLYALSEDQEARDAVVNTVLIALITVPGALAAGLGLALLANLPFRRRWPTRLALLLPWALPLVFCGLIFRWFFDSAYGVVNDIVKRLGFEPVMWLSRPSLAFAVVCLVIVWKSASFTALILLAGLQTIPGHLHEAAAVDGATRWQGFRLITLPMLLPAMAVAAVFRTIAAIQTFDIPKAVTNGGPGDTTQTLAMYIQKTTIEYLDFGYGSALAVLMVLASLAATALYLRLMPGTDG